MLRLFQRMMHGPVPDDLPQRPDLRPIELLALAPLVVAIVLLGIYPAPVAESGASVSTAQLVGVRQR